MNKEVKDIDLTISYKLRSLRKDKKITLKEVAEKIDTSKPLIFYYETGKMRIPISTLYEILKLLNVSLSEFFKDIN